jgi:uncharacterized protein YgiM (DUF1202 family)
MKKILVVLCLFLLVTGITAAQAFSGGTYYVAVKTVTLKSGAGFFAGNKGTLKYGDKVTVLKVDGKFAEVKSATNSSVTGWIATSNLSARQVVSGTKSTASAKEVALAGKGFNQEVENTYKNQKNKKINYADVDKTEAITVNESELKKFLEEGRLKMGDN